MKLRFGSSLLALLVIASGGCMTPPETGKEEKIPVRTAEDMERGKQNVKSVSDELRALFKDEAPIPQPGFTPRKVTPAYSKIVSGGEDRATLVFRPRYTTAKKISRALEGVIPLNSLVESVVGQNLVIINASEKEIGNYRNLIEAMDVPQAQVLIEAKVVELIFSDTMLRNLSMSWQGRHGSLGAITEIPGQTTQQSAGWNGSFTPINGQNTMNIAFQWLESAQDAKVLSSPTILLAECDEVSKITTGEEIPIQEANTVSNNLSITTKFKSVGVALEVEPSLINDDSVTLRVFPKVSNVTRYEVISTGTAGASYPVPVIAARSVETFLKMHHNQVVMMGGLYRSTKTLQEQRVPGLSDIPLIGEFFTGKNDATEVTQLVFFLKVHIIPPAAAAEDFFLDIDHSAKLSESLGNMVRSTESFPVRKNSFEKLKDELTGSLPGYENAKRDAFRRSDLHIKRQGEKVQEIQPEKNAAPQDGKVDNAKSETAATVQNDKAEAAGAEKK